MVTSNKDKDPQQQQATPPVDEMICQCKKQTSMTSYFAVRAPPKKSRGTWPAKKVVAARQVEILGNKAHHQEEAPPAPAVGGSKNGSSKLACRTARL
jgi:hypothetical protein